MTDNMLHTDSLKSAFAKAEASIATHANELGNAGRTLKDRLREVSAEHGAGQATPSGVHQIGEGMSRPDRDVPVFTGRSREARERMDAEHGSGVAHDGNEVAQRQKLRELAAESLVEGRVPGTFEMEK